MRFVRAPFWTRIPVLGLRKYPVLLWERFVFWLSAFLYSIIYFYVIALMVVVFTHALWAWTSIQNYITTTLFDVVYKNLWLVIVFVAIEAGTIYLDAKNYKTSTKPAVTRKVTYKLFLYPLIVVAVMYLVLKLLTRNFVLEPNVSSVLITFYVFFVILYYLVDKYIPKT